MGDLPSHGVPEKYSTGRLLIRQLLDTSFLRERMSLWLSGSGVCLVLLVSVLMMLLGR